MRNILPGLFLFLMPRSISHPSEAPTNIKEWMIIEVELTAGCVLGMERVNLHLLSLTDTLRRKATTVIQRTTPERLISDTREKNKTKGTNNYRLSFEDIFVRVRS